MSLEGFKTLGSGSVSGQSVPIPGGSWVEWLIPYNGVTWWYLKGVLAHVSTQSWWLYESSVASILTRPFTLWSKEFFSPFEFLLDWEKHLKNMFFFNILLLSIYFFKGQYNSIENNVGCVITRIRDQRNMF